MSDAAGTDRRGSGRLWRVRDRSTFAALRRQGRRRRRGPVAVTWLEEPGAGRPPRVAYAVGRRVGTAVLRNRLRRRLRAVMAEAANRLRPGAYLVSADAGALDLSAEELRASVESALRAVGALEGPT